MAMINEKHDGTGDTMLVATFFLGEAAFGIDTSMVQEVVRMAHITPIRHAPAWVVGIMNLRGRIVTIIDLRVKLDFPRTEPTEESRIFIVEWQGEQVGLLVDRVTDAINVEPSALRSAPENVQGTQGQQVRGVYRAGEGRLAALLGLESVLNLEEDKLVLSKGSPK
jgi:purine-binding chemotaxis protein CheW